MDPNQPSQQDIDFATSLQYTPEENTPQGNLQDIPPGTIPPDIARILIVGSAVFLIGIVSIGSYFLGKTTATQFTKKATTQMVVAPTKAIAQSIPTATPTPTPNPYTVQREKAECVANAKAKTDKLFIGFSLPSEFVFTSEPDYEKYCTNGPIYLARTYTIQGTRKEILNKLRAKLYEMGYTKTLAQAANPNHDNTIIPDPNIPTTPNVYAPTKTDEEWGQLHLFTTDGSRSITATLYPNAKYYNERYPHPTITTAPSDIEVKEIRVWIDDFGGPRTSFD